MNTEKRERIRWFAKKATALAVSLVMVSEMVPLSLFDDNKIEIPGIRSLLTAFATGADGDLTSDADVRDYAATYKADPSSHQNDTITINFTSATTVEAFDGIGTESYPFSGTIKIANVSNDNGGASSYLSLKSPLFNYISDTATIVDANGGNPYLYLSAATLSDGSTYTTPLFANHVVGKGNETAATPVNWKIRVNGANARSSIIGDMISSTVTTEGENPTTVTINPLVNLTYYNESATISGTSDLGLVINSIDAGELALTLSNGAEATTISTSGNVGGLVGKMESGTTLTLNSDITYSSMRSVTTTGGYAGGIVGSCKGEVAFGNHTYTDDQETTLITGYSGAGGLFGYLEVSSDYTINLDNFTVTTAQNGATTPGVGVQATAEYACVGGIIGKLVNAGNSVSPVVVTILGTSMNNETPVVKTTLAARNSYSNGGGLIGTYHAMALEDSLNIENLYIHSCGEFIKQYYGGIIAIVESEDGCGAYVRIQDITVYSDYNPVNIEQYQDNSKSSGLICYTQNSFLDVCGSITPREQVHVGLLYAVPSGVVRLAGQTDLHSLTIGSNVLIAANRGNALIYAAGTGTNYDSENQTGWNYTRPSTGTMDDITPWGQVVRLVDNKSIDDLYSSVATWDSSAHTLTLASAVSAMGTPSDFARTALNIQLNTGGTDFGALKFTDQSSSTASALLATDLTDTANISLSGTGITGFTRDNVAQAANTNVDPAIPAISGSGNFTGTFKPSGADVTLTLATGEAYGYKGSGTVASTATGIYTGSLVSANNMTGAIVTHRDNGLFAHLGACTIGDDTYTLTIAGSITVCSGGSEHHVGGIASDIVGTPVAIQNVIANTINS